MTKQPKLLRNRNFFGVFRFCVVILSAVLMLCGIGFILLGAAGLVYVETYKHLVGTAYKFLPCVVVAIGSLIEITIFYGVYVFKKKIRSGFYTFALASTAIALAAIFTVIFVCASRNKIGSNIEFAMGRSLDAYKLDNMDVLDAWDFIQSEMLCCGVKSHEDYFERNMTLPLSCCEIPVATCTDAEERPGCFQVLYDSISPYLVRMATLMIFTAIIALLNLLIVGLLARELKKIDEYCKDVEEYIEDPIEESTDSNKISQTRSAKQNGKLNPSKKARATKAKKTVEI